MHLEAHNMSVGIEVRQEPEREATVDLRIQSFIVICTKYSVHSTMKFLHKWHPCGQNIKRHEQYSK